MTPFEIIGSVTHSKIDVSDVDTFQKDYSPFMINRGLAQHKDCVLFAQEMNKYAFLTKEMQFKFYLHALKKQKRFGKWTKKSEETSSEDLDVVCRKYNVSQEKGMVYLEILTPQQIQFIKDSMNKGGRA